MRGILRKIVTAASGKEAPRYKTITVEIVARVSVPEDTPMHLLMLDKNLDIPLRVIATAPGQASQEVDVDVLTVQSRTTPGDVYLTEFPNKYPVPPRGKGGGSG